LVAQEILSADDFPAEQEVILANNPAELVVRTNREGTEASVATLAFFP